MESTGKEIWQLTKPDSAPAPTSLFSSMKTAGFNNKESDTAPAPTSLFSSMKTAGFNNKEPDTAPVPSSTFSTLKTAGFDNKDRNSTPALTSLFPTLKTSGINKEDGEPTIFPGIIFKDGKYLPIGLDPYFDCLMSGRIKWLYQTQGGKNIPPDDNSIYAREAAMCGLPPQDIACTTKIDSRPSGGFNFKISQFDWLGDRTNLCYMGYADAHHCAACKLVLENFVPGDTFLNQHAYFTGGECPYLKANYSVDRLKIEIGQERFRRGFIAHPNVITVPDAWKLPEVIVTNRIYLTLATREWCYLCGCSPGDHKQDCYEKMSKLKNGLKNGLLEFKL